MDFFEKYLRIKIEKHKILVLMSKLSQKLDEVITSYSVNIHTFPKKKKKNT